MASDRLFKGIALFTPAGDLIYSLDAGKRDRWHLQLCTALQERLGLPEPPHFLIPGYTATVDRWYEAQSGAILTAAEMYPFVQRYRFLLDALFGLTEGDWQVRGWADEACNPLVLDGYRQRFPQLWQPHDLVVRVPASESEAIAPRIEPAAAAPPGYVLRLFVSGRTRDTERTLATLHQWLESGLSSPYTLKIIDIYKHPEQAEINHVSATPTLVRVWPLPEKRIVGFWEDPARLLQSLASDPGAIAALSSAQIS